MALSWFRRDWTDETEARLCEWDDRKLLNKKKNPELYPAVVVQQTSEDDGVQEDIMRSDYVVEILSLLNFVPQLIPRAFQHLNTQKSHLTFSFLPHFTNRK